MKFVGDSSYAIQSPRFPIKRWLKIMSHIQEARPICTCLWKVFGNSPDGIHAFMEQFKDREKGIEIFMGNGAGRHKDNSGKGHFLPGIRADEYSRLLRKKDAELFAKIDDRAQEITDFCKSIDDGKTQFFMCWDLEDDLANDAHEILDNRGKLIWPWKTVRCSSSRSGAEFLEKHGSGAKGDSKTFCNQDGDETFTEDEAKKFLARNTGAYAAILWDRKAQGSGLPRIKRTFEISQNDVKVRGKLLSRY